jgi:hypothetical protein
VSSIELLSCLVISSTALLAGDTGEASEIDDEGGEMPFSSNTTGPVGTGGPRYELLCHFAGTIALGRLGDLAGLLVEVVGLKGPITVMGSLDQCGPDEDDGAAGLVVRFVEPEV